MSLSARDRKIIMILVPIAIVAAYWLLLLSPKREEQTKEKNRLTQAQGERDTAAARLGQLQRAKRSFATDYETVIRLGKSIPASLDMPSLLIELYGAARGTGIDFISVQSGSGGGSQSSGSGSSGSSGSPAAGAANASLPGLTSVPLSFEFDGDFNRLADFFHRLKRYVQVANGQLIVRGRLMTIDSFSFKTQEPQSSAITADFQATVYLAPKAEGITGGATPQGPAGTTTTTTSSPAASPAPPAATVTR